MLIVCPNCATSYQVEPASLGGRGRSVRCARCRSVWFATPTAEVRAAVSAEPEPPPPPAEPAPQDEVPADEVPVPEVPPPEVPPPQGAPAPDADPWAEAFAEAAATRPTQALPTAAGMARMESPSLVPQADPFFYGSEMLPDRPRSAIPAEDIETFAARRAPPPPRRGPQIRAPILTALIATLVVIEGALVLWRANVVARWPQTASFYRAVGLPVNLRGLSFENVAGSQETRDGTNILVVQGRIVNTAPRTVEVPRLRYAIRDGQGREIYSWTSLPSRPVLSSGEALPFHSRLASPPVASHDVVVRFFNRRDASAASR